MMDMKVGVLGTGFGAYHVEQYSKIKEIEEIFVYGRNRFKLEELRNRFNVIPIYCIDDILNNAQIELVDICLPNDLHAQYSIEALEKGKHILCEVPVTLSIEDAKAIINAQKVCNKLAMVDLFLRFDFAYYYLQNLCRIKTYGELKFIQIQRKTAPRWGDLGIDKISTDLMIHDLDFITWLLDAPKEVTAKVIKGPKGQCTVSSLHGHENACSQIIASSMMPNSYPFAVSYEATFERAVVRYFKDYHNDKTVSELMLFADNRDNIEIREENCYENVIRHAVNCVQYGIEPINTVSDALKSLNIALEIKKQLVEQDEN